MPKIECQNSTDRILAQQIPVHSEQYLYLFTGRYLSELVDQAACALAMDDKAVWSGPESRTEINTLLNTGEFIRNVHWGITDTDKFKLHIEPRYFKDSCCEEGLINVNVSCFDEAGDSQRKTRLFEIGLVVNDRGDLIISRMQRHLLGLPFRATANHLDEKKRGDYYYREFERKTGLQPEAFGIVCAVMAFAKHIPSGIMEFPLFQEQPSVKGLIRELIADSGDSLLQGRVNGIKDRIRELNKKTDFHMMLSQLGVTEDIISTEGKFIRVPVDALKTAVIQKFNDYHRVNSDYYKEAVFSLAQRQEYDNNVF